jgi:hypothetical protein
MRALKATVSTMMPTATAISDLIPFVSTDDQASVISHSPEIQATLLLEPKQCFGDHQEGRPPCQCVQRCYKAVNNWVPGTRTRYQHRIEIGHHNVFSSTLQGPGRGDSARARKPILTIAILKRTDTYQGMWTAHWSMLHETSFQL